MKALLYMKLNSEIPHCMSIHKRSNEIITTKNRCDGEFTLYKVIVVHVTDYYLANQCAAMQQIYEKSPNCYVLFVGYEDGDAQPGITGSCIQFSKGVYERPSVAAVRELEEETGFTTNRGNLEWFDTRYYSDIGRHATIYLLDVQKCVEAVDVKIDNSKSGKKVAVLPYGSRDEIVKMAHIAKAIDPNEQISYYSVVHISHAVKIVQHIRNRKYEKISEKFYYHTLYSAPPPVSSFQSTHEQRMACRTSDKHIEGECITVQ